MKRVFTFGCSYTSYAWLTWAKFLELEFDHVENWGLAGLGNRAIAERVAEANIKNKFTKDDLIIVQWSSHLRNDWYHLHSMPQRTAGWKTYGSIFNYHNQELYDQKWIDTFFFEPGSAMHTLNHISLTQGLLNSIGATWYMTSIGDIRNMGEDIRSGVGYGEQTGIFAGDILKEKLLWQQVPSLQVYEKSIWEDHSTHWLMPLELFCQTCPELTFEFIDSTDNRTFLDIHPSAGQHLLWVEQELKDILHLSDDLFNFASRMVSRINEMQIQSNNDKKGFEMQLAKQQYSYNDKSIRWPGRPLGF